jgi:hypothetical protein
VNLCSKPGCARPGAAVLAYDYEAGRALLDDPSDVVSPHHYVLCSRCAEKLRPPQGWVLEDYRSKPRVFVAHVPDPFEVESDAADRDDEESGRKQLTFGYRA